LSSVKESLSLRHISEMEYGLHCCTAASHNSCGIKARYRAVGADRQTGVYPLDEVGLG